jgi:hypothetical protein
MADSGSAPFAAAAVRMPAAQPSATPASRSWRQIVDWRPPAWRIVPMIDNDPRLIAWVQRLPGRIGLVFCFVLVLHSGTGPAAAGLAAACAYAGRYRWHVIPVATLALLWLNGFWIDGGIVARVAAQEGLAQEIDQSLLMAGMLGLVFALFCCVIGLWRSLAATWIGRRSTLVLLLLFVALVAIGESPICRGVPRVVVWSFLVTVLPFFWFFAYALGDVRAGDPAPFWQRLGLFHSFWGATLTPFGKGVAYLRRVEAQTPADLAVTQLKGLKLLLWAALLSIVLRLFAIVVHQYLAIPAYDDAFARQIAGHPYPWYVCWLSLFAFFVDDLLRMAAWGGPIIACARLAGFRLLRNTYNPMAATTIAEFWNRYYFYYKELLVDHFFFPTFFSCFRKYRRLRVFFATFMAACVGNLLFHFMRDIRFVVDMGPAKALIGEESHAFYTFILALGIACSQLRPRSIGQPSRGWLRARLLPALRVMLFFCLLHIFDAPVDRVHTIGQRMGFLLHLFGLDLWL